MDRWIVHVDLPFACFGLIVDERKIVIDAAPIARYTIGWNAGRAKRYLLGRGAKVHIADVAQ